MKNVPRHSGMSLAVSLNYHPGLLTIRNAPGKIPEISVTLDFTLDLGMLGIRGKEYHISCGRMFIPNKAYIQEKYISRCIWFIYQIIGVMTTE